MFINAVTRRFFSSRIDSIHLMTLSSTSAAIGFLPPPVRRFFTHWDCTWVQLIDWRHLGRSTRRLLSVWSPWCSFCTCWREEMSCWSWVTYYFHNGKAVEFFWEEKSCQYPKLTEKMTYFCWHFLGGSVHGRTFCQTHIISMTKVCFIVDM